MGEVIEMVGHTDDAARVTPEQVLRKAMDASPQEVVVIMRQPDGSTWAITSALGSEAFEMILLAEQAVVEMARGAPDGGGD